MSELNGQVDKLRELQVHRKNVVRTINGIVNRCRAFTRRAIGFQGDFDAKTRKAINKRAEAVVKRIFTGKPPRKGDEAIARGVAGFVGVLHKQSIVPLTAHRKQLEKQMEELAETLPVWPWWESIRGLGALGLAKIVGEAGDLNLYDNPAKLWKRMGVATPESYDDVTKDGKPCRKIPRERRSELFTIGDSLIKGNRDGDYRTLYLEHKAKQAERPEVKTKMHAHKRAQRYMEKRLLRNLWRAWTRDGGQAKGDPQPVTAPVPS